MQPDTETRDWVSRVNAESMTQAFDSDARCLHCTLFVEKCGRYARDPCKIATRGFQKP